jgi:hypothetical protein
MPIFNLENVADEGVAGEGPSEVVTCGLVQLAFLPTKII